MNNDNGFLDYLGDLNNEVSNNGSSTMPIDEEETTQQETTSPEETQQEETTTEETLLEETETETESQAGTLITVEPDILYQKLDTINDNISFISIILVLYISFEFLGRWLHIRKEGDI